MKNPSEEKKRKQINRFIFVQNVYFKYKQRLYVCQLPSPKEIFTFGFLFYDYYYTYYFKKYFHFQLKTETMQREKQEK